MSHFIRPTPLFFFLDVYLSQQRQRTLTERLSSTEYHGNLSLHPLELSLVAYRSKLLLVVDKICMYGVEQFQSENRCRLWFSPALVWTNEASKNLHSLMMYWDSTPLHKLILRPNLTSGRGQREMLHLVGSSFRRSLAFSLPTIIWSCRPPLARLCISTFFHTSVLPFSLPSPTLPH